MRATIGVAALSVTLCGGLLLIFALEGVLCLAMAAVLALPLACLGAVVGRAWAGERKVAAAMAIGWPLLAFMPWDRAADYPVRAVVSRAAGHASVPAGLSTTGAPGCSRSNSVSAAPKAPRVPLTLALNLRAVERECA